MMRNKRDITVVVRWCLGVIAEVALVHAGAAGVPRDWELRDSTGRLLEPKVRVRDSGLLGGETLYLSPAVGIGASV